MNFKAAGDGDTCRGAFGPSECRRGVGSTTAKSYSGGERPCYITAANLRPPFFRRLGEPLHFPGSGPAGDVTNLYGNVSTVLNGVLNFSERF